MGSATSLTVYVYPASLKFHLPPGQGRQLTNEVNACFWYLAYSDIFRYYLDDLKITDY